jgi:hypothetical protein
MPARHILAANHDIAGRFAPEYQRRPADHILPSVGQTHEPAAGIRGDARRLGPGPGQCLRRLHRPQELRAPVPSLVHEVELVARHVELVPVQEWRRLRAEADAVDQDLGGGGRLADHHVSVRSPLKQGVLGQNPASGHHNPARGVAAEHQLTHGNEELVATQLKQRHL